MDSIPRIDQYATRTPENPSGLEDLVEVRQKRWMWGYLPRWSRQHISEYVVHLARTNSQCHSMWSHKARNPLPRRGIPLSRPGDDGLYHLVSEAGLWCGCRESARPVAPELDHDLAQHERVPAWWGDGRSGRWNVTLREETLGPEMVPYGKRCPLPPRIGAWAPYCGQQSPESRIRRVLIDSSGRACAICGVAPGTVVDHDHFSGLVRGLICIDCNSRVDWCPHVRDCMFADYLNSPPAADLRLKYKGKLRDYEDVLTAAAIGVGSILDTPPVSDWQWKPRRYSCSLVECRTRDGCCKWIAGESNSRIRS